MYKKDSLPRASNHWPITLLSLISKVIEKVIQDQTSASVNSKICYTIINLVSEKNHSTDFCRFFLNGKIIKGFHKCLITAMNLIYLQKLFDRIKHDILLQRLHAIGFSEHSLNWFRS